MRPCRPHLRLGARTLLGAAVALGAVALGVSCGDEGDTPPGPSSGGATTTTSSDAGSDAAPPPWPHCSRNLGPLPAWVELDGAAHRFIAHGTDVEVRLAALDDATLRLSYSEVGGALPAQSFAVASVPAAAAELSAGEAEGELELCTAEYVVRVAPATCRVLVKDAAGTVLLEDAPAGGFRRETELVDGQSVLVSVLERLTPASEHFYGTGERTGTLDRRGTSATFWGTDAYDSLYGGYAPGADPLYASIPFLIGLRGATAYGLFVDHTLRMQWDLAQHSPDRLVVRGWGPVLDQYLVLGPAMPEVLRRYTALSGRAPLPPRWALGYHQSRWGYSPDSALLDIAAQFRARHIPADGLWLDIQHLDGFRTFTWDPAAFPDPDGLSASLAAQGLKLTVIADPGIKVDPGWSVYDGGLAADVFLRWPNGDPFVGVVWPGDSVFPDFTLAAARQWWGEQVAIELDHGVRGLWLDVNEPTVFPESGGGATIPNEVLAYGHDGSANLGEIHNVYALEEARATYQAMATAKPEHRPFLLSRAGYAGIQRYAAMWTGDAPSRWDTFASTLPMLLNLGLSGVPIVGSDVGGYSGNATPELYARWISLGALSPFFRGHVTQGVPGQEPWAFGTEVEDISRSLIGLRYELLPYLYSLVHEASERGAPVLRPLVYEFQNDASVATLGDELMLGPYLLAAPVTAQGATSRSIYLPAGRWYEYHSGAVVDGPATIEVGVTLAALPLYVREGAIVPHGPQLEWTDQAPLDPLRLDIYPASAPSSFELYEDEGDGLGYQTGCYSLTRFTTEQTAMGARLDIAPRQGSCPPPARRLEVRLRRADHGASGVSLAGVPLASFGSYAELAAAGSGYWVDADDLSIVVALGDTDDATIELYYDTALGDPSPPVLVPLEVTAPAGTPPAPLVHVSSSANGWSQQPFDWAVAPQIAQGLLVVPRGEWFYYKYTRGDWTTVEKWPGCVEATNRYGFGAAHPLRQDTVYAWADLCP